ncbi:hypothetical protein BH10PSE9_BH10PSE9_21000 [soil metagenome]
MRQFLRFGGLLLAVGSLMGVGAADAGKLVWKFQQNEQGASIAVVNAREIDDPSADYPFYMQCDADGGETTIVSDVNRKVLGKAIAAGDIPSFWFVVDGKRDTMGGEGGEIRYDQMAGAWQYITGGAPYDLLRQGMRVQISGVGVNLELPAEKFRQTLTMFRDACEKLRAPDAVSQNAK